MSHIPKHHGESSPEIDYSAMDPQRLESELQQSRELLTSLASQIPGIIFQYRISPEGQRSVPFVSRALFDIYGIAPGKWHEDTLLSALHPDDRDTVIASCRAARLAMQAWRCEFRVVLPDQSVCWHLGQAQPDKRADGSVLWHGYISDITEKKTTEELLWRQVNFDVLTGLPNRRLFHHHLEQTIRKARRDNTMLALMFLGLDHFKDINDTLGHEMGDTLLQQAAKRLRSCVRESDIVARLGGDEFIVVLNNLADSGSVKRVTLEILHRFTEPFTLGNHTSYVSASIGITLYPQDATGIEDLLKNADHAMCAAKKKGRNRFNYFTPLMQKKAQHRIALVNDLRAALVDYPFQLYYQPIVELPTGAVHKAEALLRWQHPVRGLVNPGEFISTAEDSGMIGDIGNWVFHAAAKQAAIWRAMLHPEFQVSINLSPAQFRADDDMLESWLEHLPQLGISGQGIAVEITEGLLLDASVNVTNRLLALRDAGIQVALDDFGTGYSSLSYLKKFDIDYIKIDRSFIQNLETDSSDLALCEAIIVMAHKLGLKVIAEGVETHTQRELLTIAGCDYAQGYLFSRPVPAVNFEQWLGAKAAIN